MAYKETPSTSIAAEENQIAKAVLMPGDPLRAKYVAEHYLENPVCFNTVRNMLGYTGTYKGKKISVMGHGMGVPSVGIYNDNTEAGEMYRKFGILALEMETAGLYWTAQRLGKQALSLLTISDHIFTGESLSAQERQESFREMMEIALDTAWESLKD